MSVSLYYTAKRAWPITLQEQIACNKIADRYDSQYPFGELYEGFCIYDLTKDSSLIDDQQNVIFSGSTKLPSNVDNELFGNILDWWLECLHEITNTLTDAQWHVHIDDVTIEWDKMHLDFNP